MEQALFDDLLQSLQEANPDISPVLKSMSKVRWKGAMYVV
ncbi:hypothetical protein GWL_24200 [Herbaspirillum sp. GW103]|nr:hypothetical protein GWL_24200 [Herbaspirillum sp. GW103]